MTHTQRKGLLSFVIMLQSNKCYTVQHTTQITAASLAFDAVLNTKMAYPPPTIPVSENALIHVFELDMTSSQCGYPICCPGDQVKPVLLKH